MGSLKVTLWCPGRAAAVRLAAAVALVLLPATTGAQRSSPTPASELIDAVRLVDDLKTLSSDDMAGRRTGSAGAAMARRLIEQRFREAGLQPVGASFEHPFEPTSGARGGRAVGGINLVGRITGGTNPARYLVVSAHYDHVGVRDGQIFNGANDNASGAAALSVIAAHFVKQRPATSMIFVAFDGEESGLSGSRAFVRAPPVPADAILANVNLDMIGRDASETLWIAGVRRFPVFGPMATRLAASAPIRVRIGHDDPSNGDEEDWTRDSDQYAFIEAGIPALYIGVEDYKYLHRPDDDFESMMPAFYVSAVETVVHLLGDIDAGAGAIVRARAAAR